jgi:protein-L-isoaspartate(D-aspartate) O-methyltransferase
MSEIHYAPEGAEAGSARRAMIDSQLRTCGVNEPWVLSALAGVAREDYVPAESRAAAYIDRAVPLGNGRALPAPLFHGKLLGAAEPKNNDKVLVVTAGSDYLAAVMGRLAGNVDKVDAAALSGGLPGTGYSLIVIDGAAGEVPAVLEAALAADGRIVTGLVDKGISRLAIGRKVAGAVSYLPLADLGIPAIAEMAAPKNWSF